MNKKLFVFIHCLRVHLIIHNTTVSRHHQVLAKKDILDSGLIACCKLAPALARQM